MGCGCGLLKVMLKVRGPGHAYAQPRPWPAQTTEGDVAGVLFGYGGGGVVATAVGLENQGLRWVAKAVGGAGSAPGGVHVLCLLVDVRVLCVLLLLVAARVNQ